MKYLYVDASFHNGIGGLGAVYRDEEDRVVRRYKAIETVDNNIAELEAIKFGLESLEINSGRNLVIFTDSAYCLVTLENVTRYDGKRRELAESILKRVGNGVEFRLIKGHVNSPSQAKKYSQQAEHTPYHTLADSLSKTVRKQYEYRRKLMKNKVKKSSRNIDPTLVNFVLNNGKKR